jgi:hypothetical protein
MLQSSVVVQHVEGTDWALVLVATRSEYGRRSITPMIFACEGCGIFAVAPTLRRWIRAGQLYVYNPPPERREEILNNAVSEFVRQVSLRAFIRERSKVGIVARVRARSNDFNEPPEGFELNREQEPALFYLCEKSETACQALRVLRFLINKNHIGALTRAEREAIGKKLLTRDDVLKSPNQILNQWRQQ